MITVQYHRGIFLPQLDLWLDPREPQTTAFVSHAHSDHFANHETILTSKPTAYLLKKRFQRVREVQALSFRERMVRGDYQLELLPAGHILGSAQLLIRHRHTGQSLLYSGDFKLQRNGAAEPIELVAADTLIMETTFGLAHFQFPPAAEVVSQVVRFCQDALYDGDVPVLLAYSLGKSQEVLKALSGSGLHVLLHPTAYRMAQCYEVFGHHFSHYESFTEEKAQGRVLLFPPNTLRSTTLRAIKNKRVAMLSGWALEPGAKFRFQCDEVFALSDHADYNDLQRYVAEVDPARVYTVHGFAKEFARDLRRQGVEAWALGGDNQMELSLGVDTPTAPPPNEEDMGAPPPSEFSFFARTCEEIASTSSKRKKIEILARYLRGLEKCALERAATYLTGQPFADPEARYQLQVGWALIRRALLEISGMGEARYRSISQAQNDAGRTTYLVLQNATCPEPFSLEQVHGAFEQLRESTGPSLKKGALCDTLARLHPLEAQYFVKILTGDLRIGLKEGLLEEAMAQAFEADAQAIRDANMMLGDIGRTAFLAAVRRLREASIRLFQPVKCMLASAEPEVEKIWNSLAPAVPEGEPPAPILLEDKYDGIRFQLHKRDQRVEIYSRDLRIITHEFPELARSARALDADVILDGEIIAYDGGRKLSFFDLQKRLGRREPDLFMQDDIPVRGIIFDILWRNGASLLKAPLKQRRRILESLCTGGSLEIAPLHLAHGPAEIEAHFARAREQGQEGLMAKDPQSTYSPGRRGRSWIKLKRAFATLDVVVVAAERGHGKRSHLLSDYTFAVRDGEEDRLLVIGKAYSGLTDAEIEELTEHFLATTVKQRGRVYHLAPEIVLEVAFDAIQASNRHDSGLALRFPRIVAVRRDKTPREIDTLQSAFELVDGNVDGANVS